jgi:hypothetical protein
VRFREHEQYKGRQGAVRAFAKRCPELSKEKTDAIFDFYDSLHQATVEAAKDALPLRGTTDEDLKALFDSIINKLHLKFPHQDNSTLSSFINWVIYWHILR